MYNAAGNLGRLSFVKSQFFDNNLPVPTRLKIRSIENSDFDIQTKIEILEIFNHNRFVTDILFNRKNQKNTIILLKQLELSFFKSSKISRKNGKKFYFFIVTANKVILEYIKKFEYELNDFELGILYGYHPKSILSFSNLIEPLETVHNIEPYIFYNQKVFSKQFFEEEKAYHKIVWEQLRNLSPKIIKQAEEDFNSMNK